MRKPMREKFRQFMIGRYGTDGLNQFLSMSSIVMLLVSLLTRVSLFTWLGAALLILCYYRSLSRKPLGHWLFSRLICFKAPYFGSIGPRMVRLEPGRGEATIRHRRSVTNHLGTVHAIALCNLAEFVGGLTTDVSIPRSMRGIPKGMTVEYLKKAVGTMHAVATPAFEPHESAEGYDLPMDVVVSDPKGEPVFRARIGMWVSPKPPRAASPL